MLSTIRYAKLSLLRVGGGTTVVRGVSYRVSVGAKKYRIWWCKALDQGTFPTKPETQAPRAAAPPGRGLPWLSFGRRA